MASYKYKLDLKKNYKIIKFIYNNVFFFFLGQGGLVTTLTLMWSHQCLELLAQEGSLHDSKLSLVSK